MWSEPRRAHPAGVILYSLRFLGALVAPAVGVLFAFGPRAEERWFALGTAVLIAIVVLAAATAVLLAWLQWRRFTFHVDGGALRVEQGLLIRKSTRLTPERIQSVDTKANLLFRVLGLVTVDIHTAGRGQEPEVSIPALVEDEARDLVATLRRRGAVEPAHAEGEGGTLGVPAEEGAGGVARPVAAPASGPAWRLTGKELAVVAATSNAALLVLAAVGPVVGALAPMVSIDTLGEWFAPVSGVWWIVLGVLASMVFLVSAWVIGSVATAMQYWDFLTVRTDGEVRIEQGLLQRNTRNVPLDRVQAVRLIEGPLRQMIGRVTVGVDSAGLATGSELGPTVLHPLLGRRDAVRFCDLMVPGHDAPPLLPLPERSRRRYVIRTMIVPLVLAIPLVVWQPVAWPALLVVLPAAAAWALLAYRDAAWGLRGDVLALRWRGFGRTTALVRRRRVQSIEVSQHPLQKRADLVTLSVRVAASPSTAVFTVRHLDAADAERVLEWVSRGVERTSESV